MRSLIDHKICIIGVDLVMRRRIAGFHVASSDQRRWKIITNSRVDIFIKDMLVLDETRTPLKNILAHLKTPACAVNYKIITESRGFLKISLRQTVKKFFRK